nr:hypothetical protein [Heliobacterium chlorum]
MAQIAEEVGVTDRSLYHETRARLHRIPE